MSGVLKYSFNTQLVENLLQHKEHEQQTNKLIKEASLNEEDDRLMCNYVVSLLNHLQTCGTTPSQITTVINYFTSFIKNTCQTNLIDAVRTLHQTVANLNCLNQYQMKSVLEFLNSTYFHHYTLYQYVLTRQRQLDYTHLYKDVAVVEQPAPLSTGVEESQYRYEERVATINRQHSAALTEAQNTTLQHNPVEKLHGGSVHQESVKDLITIYVKKQCESLEKEVELSLRLSELALEKEVALLEACAARNARRGISPNMALKKSPTHRRSAANSRK